MDREELLDLLQHSSIETQHLALRRAVDFLSSGQYISHKRTMIARRTIELAVREEAPELLMSVALLLVPDGFDGDFSFGRGPKRAVLFSSDFVAYGNEPPIEAEHDAPAIALAEAAIKALT